MARIKVLAARIASGTAWLVAATATLAAAYGGSAAAAHIGTWIEWR